MPEPGRLFFPTASDSQSLDLSRSPWCESLGNSAHRLQAWQYREGTGRRVRAARPWHGYHTEVLRPNALICCDPWAVDKCKPHARGDHWLSQLRTGESPGNYSCWFWTVTWLEMNVDKIISLDGQESPIHQRKLSVRRSSQYENLDVCHLICCFAISTECSHAGVRERGVERQAIRAKKCKSINQMKMIRQKAC